MMRQIVGAITGIFLALYFMFFVIPLMSTEHTLFSASPYLVNTTDTVTSTSYNLGQGFYTFLPMIPIGVAAFVLINYALKRDASD